MQLKTDEVIFWFPNKCRIWKVELRVQPEKFEVNSQIVLEIIGKTAWERNVWKPLDLGVIWRLLPLIFWRNCKIQVSYSRSEPLLDA